MIKELGFEVDFTSDEVITNKANNIVNINGEVFKVPNILLDNNFDENSNIEIIKALNFNKNLLMQNFILPNSLKLPVSRDLLEKYYN